MSYLIGVTRGVVLANVYSQNKYAKAILCIPDNKFAEAYGDPVQALQQEIASPGAGHPYAADTPIEIVILQALLSRYPCH